MARLECSDGSGEGGDPVQGAPLSVSACFVILRVKREAACRLINGSLAVEGNPHVGEWEKQRPEIFQGLCL